MRFLLFFLPLLISISTMAAPIEPGDSLSNGDITPAVIAAIKSGNAGSLAAYFHTTIDLTLPGSEGTYSKSQAELIVKGFFSTNPPENFTINHKGSSGEGSQFCIGMLNTGNGNFRTYFLIKTMDGKSVITQLQFEEE